ncbi:hypothetical protein L6452_32588 [Arctium lappa]|uniref:Uncharacterized protein n=1 Tax=Arctium lappa TaxID=4217 RepID=A0ACB8Z4Z3_ARCLA|nr:hypothetical protein L6452_32588 [Arctium lappa]
MWRPSSPTIWSLPAGGRWMSCRFAPYGSTLFFFYSFASKTNHIVKAVAKQDGDGGFELIEEARLFQERIHPDGGNIKGLGRSMMVASIMVASIMFVGLQLYGRLFTICRWVLVTTEETELTMVTWCIERINGIDDVAHRRR